MKRFGTGIQKDLISKDVPHQWNLSQIWLLAFSLNMGVTIMRAGLMSAVFALAFGSAVHAQAVSNNMSCSKAVAHYERNGRINTTTRNGATIPIYDGVPVSQRSRLQCRGTPVMLRTTDNPRCVIAYKCASDRSH